MGSARAAAPPTTPRSTSPRSRWPRARRSRWRWRRPRSAADRERLELARAQHHDQLALGALDADRGDRALLEVDPRAGEVVHGLREIGVVADDQDARVGVVAAEQLERVAGLEPVGEDVLDLGLDVERLGGELRGALRAHLR